MSAARLESGNSGRGPREIAANRRRRVAAGGIAEAGGRSRLVVYVHGIGQHPPAAEVKRNYDQALFGRDVGDRSRLAFWADILHPFPEDIAAQPGLGAQSFAAADSEESLAEIIENHPEARDLAEALQDRIEASLMAQDIDIQVRLEAHMESASRAALTVKFLPPGLLRRRLTRWFTRTFIPDVAAYIFDDGVRARIQQRLKALLPRGDTDYILVTHSLGTVIAYDVLSELSEEGVLRDGQVPLWVTLGSPLGIPELQDFIHQPLEIPSAVTRWHNFADALDPIVGLDVTLNDEFQADPGQIVDDRDFQNTEGRRPENFNPHLARGYLANPNVREVVQDSVGSSFNSPVGGFVIARDLAAEMNGTRQRRPVLIEIKEMLEGETLDACRDRIVREIENLIEKECDESDYETAIADARIDPLRRFVAADLTSSEMARLHSRHQELKISKLWKNGQKRAFINVSVRRTQTYTAQLGYGARGRDIHWAVLDTGIAADHPHFAKHENIVAEWDCSSPGPIVSGGASDRAGHGTHVAGIIAGQEQSDSENSHVAMAPEAKLHIYKVLGDDGSGRDSNLIKALDHIASVNENSGRLVIHGVNLSLGGPFDADVYGCGFSPLCRELRRLWRMGVLVCIAAGNEGTLTVQSYGPEGAERTQLTQDLSIGDPANLDDAIVVGSISKESPQLYGVSYFSSRGPTADGRCKPDLVAPGEQINSCHHDYELGAPYVEMSGTSMACPHVSGILAAFLSVRRDFIGRPDEVKQILLKHAIDLGRDKYHQGAGMPNIVQMLAGT